LAKVELLAIDGDGFSEAVEFGWRDCFKRFTVTGGGAVFDFDKDSNTMIVENEIYFAIGSVEISRQEFESAIF
jgi:hypothetical protein